MTDAAAGTAGAASPRQSVPSGQPVQQPQVRPLTEDVPRIYPRRLPDPTGRELIRRGSHHRHRGGRALRPHRAPPAEHIRHGPLPAAQLARPLRKSFQDLGGTFMKFGQIIASSPGMFGDEVADEFRACLDTGPPVPFADVRQRVEEDLGPGPARCLLLVRTAARRDRLHRRSPPGAAARRARGGGQGAPPWDRAHRRHGPRSDAAAARDPGAPDGRPDGRIDAADARRLPRADRRGARLAKRSALHARTSAACRTSSTSA